MGTKIEPGYELLTSGAGRTFTQVDLKKDLNWWRRWRCLKRLRQTCEVWTHGNFPKTLILAGKHSDEAISKVLGHNRFERWTVIGRHELPFEVNTNQPLFFN